MEIKNYINEVWKPVRGYVGFYEVSNFGRVRSVNRTITYIDGRNCFYGSKLLTLKKDRYGYLKVELCKNNQKKQVLVHRLVAEAFIPNPHNLPQVNHKDEDKTNNCVWNLEWCDGKHNVNWGTRNERMSKNSLNKNGKTVILTTKHGIYLHEWTSVREMERQTGISHNIIYPMITKRKPFPSGLFLKYKRDVN